MSEDAATASCSKSKTNFESEESERFEDEYTRVESLKLLRSMLETEKGLRWQGDDLFLLSFLRGRKFDVNRAYNLIKSLYSCFGKHGDKYYNLNFENLKRTMENNSFYVKSSEQSDCTLAIFRYSPWNPAVTRVEDLILCVSMGFLQALRSTSTQIDGFRFVVDFNNLTFKHILAATPSVFFFLFDVLQNTVPMRVRSIHMVNENPAVHYLWKTAKYFLSRKLRGRVHLHGTDVQSLHKYVHPSILPAELGGELPPFDNTDWRKSMEASFDYIRHVLSFGYENYLTKDWKSS